MSHIELSRDTTLGHWTVDVDMDKGTMDVQLNGAHLDVRPMPAIELTELRAQGYEVTQ